MIYYKFNYPVRGTRRVYLFEHSLKSVNGIIQFEEEPSPRVRIGLRMRGYRRVADDAVAALLRTGGGSAPVSKASKGSAPPVGREAPETPPAGESEGFLSKMAKAVGKGRKPSKE